MEPQCRHPRNQPCHDVKSKLVQRIVLSFISSVYKPIELVKTRLLLKNFWRLRDQQWDDELPPKLTTKFLDWRKKLSPITSERHSHSTSLFPGKSQTLELRLFGESSQDLFSAVASLSARVIKEICKQKRNSPSC